MNRWYRSLAATVVVSVMMAGVAWGAHWHHEQQLGARIHRVEVAIAQHLVANFRGIRQLRFTGYSFESYYGGVHTTYKFQVNGKQHASYEVDGVPGELDFSTQEAGGDVPSGWYNVNGSLEYSGDTFLPRRKPAHAWRSQRLSGITIHYLSPKVIEREEKHD